MLTAWSTTLVSTSHSPMTKGYNWQIMFIMPFCHQLAACTSHLCTLSSWSTFSEQSTYCNLQLWDQSLICIRCCWWFHVYTKDMGRFHCRWWNISINYSLGRLRPPVHKTFSYGTWDILLWFKDVWPYTSINHNIPYENASRIQEPATSLVSKATDRDQF